MKSGSCMTIGGDHGSGWTQMSLRESFPSHLCTCERQCSLFFGPTSASFISNSSKLDNRSRPTIIAICSKLSWKNCWKKGRHLRTDAGSPSYRITRDHTPREKRYKKLVNWGWNLCLTYHIHRTCRQQIITFLSTWSFLHLRGKIRGNQTDLENDILQFFDSKKPPFCAAGINALVSRWKRCTDACGSYF
ncbi:hypothetical protein M514_17362, partial [Trichuris suis]